LNFRRPSASLASAGCFGGPLTIWEICCLQGNSQIVSQAGKGLELANDQGPVNQNQEQKITILLTIHNKASNDQAVQDMYGPGSATFQKFFMDADFLNYVPRRAAASTNRTADHFHLRLHVISQGGRNEQKDQAS
jgi:hypothetical protein